MSSLCSFLPFFLPVSLPVVSVDTYMQVLSSTSEKFVCIVCRACKQRDLQNRFFVIRCQKRREVYGPKESAVTGYGAADAG
jgi:hypothetical protein